MGRSRIFWAVIAALSLWALPAIAPINGATSAGYNADWTEEWFPSADGTLLRADVLRPRGLGADVRTPVILSVGPYFNNASVAFNQSPQLEGPEYRHPDLAWAFRAGYTVVQASLRGSGGSEGCTDLGGPGEQADVKAAVEWAASQPWSSGRVAMWGKSYDGWTGVMALAMRPKGLAAAVIQAPLASTYQGLYMNGLHYGVGWRKTAPTYLAADAEPNSPHASQRNHQNWAASTTQLPACAANVMAGVTNADRSASFWRERELVDRVAGTKVPVLLAHGFIDANTKPDNFLDVWRVLAGPKRAWIGQWPHERPTIDRRIGRRAFFDEAKRWLARYLKDDRGAGVENDPRVVVERADGEWRSEQHWPPSDVTWKRIPVQGQYRDGPGLDTWHDATAGGNYPAWNVSQQFPYDAHIAGSPRLTVTVSSVAPKVNVIASLYDIDPAGDVRLVTRGGAAVRPGTHTFELYPQDWPIRTGHRLAVILSGNDEFWFETGKSNAPVTVEAGHLAVPYLLHRRSENLEGSPSRYWAYASYFRTQNPSNVTAELPPPQR